MKELYGAVLDPNKNNEICMQYIHLNFGIMQ